MVVVGCVVAGAGDLSFDFWAYSYAFCSVLTQSVYLLLVEFQVGCRGKLICRTAVQSRAVVLLIYSLIVSVLVDV